MSASFGAAAPIGVGAFGAADAAAVPEPPLPDPLLSLLPLLLPESSSLFSCPCGCKARSAVTFKTRDSETLL
jgi:hypothetical protein